MGNAIQIHGDDGDECPDCGKPLGSHVLTHNSFIGHDLTPGALVRLSPSGVHLHGVTVMPFGQERLRPTLRRELGLAGLRLRHRHPYARLAGLSVVAAVKWWIRGARATASARA